MSQPKVFIVRTAGTNCDGEAKYACEKAGARADLIHTKRWVNEPQLIHQYHFLILPGGFSYGDDLGAGTVLGNELKQKLFGELHRFIREGKLILGICNGFQVMTKMGLLPGDNSTLANSQSTVTQTVTLANNDSGKFEDRWVYLKKSSARCVFTKGWYRDHIYLPVAHGEGKFVTINKKTLETLVTNDQVVFRYANATGHPTKKYPANPNGSVDNIAGICDPTGRIMGMMPHPERFTERTNHPRWTREKLKEPTDGMLIFNNAINYIKNNL
ncbi:MAG: phosphoribosylformylglycinamidine synthase I [Planctomycetes bacterium]|nr:phosphoribosylformylglycinamidine synthase I [Planctomycetota bacterium]